MMMILVFSGTLTLTVAGKEDRPRRFAASERIRSLCSSSPSCSETAWVAATVTLVLTVLRAVTAKVVELE